MLKFAIYSMHLFLFSSLIFISQKCFVEMNPDMAPNVVTSTLTCETTIPNPPVKKPYKRSIVWRNVLLFIYLHIAALYGLYLMFFSAKLATVAFAILAYQVAALGITAGAHRLWSHRSYKAKYPLQILLAFFNTVSFQNSIYEWARDHRLHHKYSETNADPHNATRGFFFSHIGWLLCRKHPDVMEKGKGIDMSDLKENPVVMFQHRHYLKLMPLCCFIIPTMIPMYFWGESFVNSWFVATMFRYCFSLNMTWLVNSAAHMWGNRPYDKNINPAENFVVAIGASGEGWHNYHHVFPWDYKAAELGDYKMNFTTAFIDFMARIGQAYDCKIVPDSVVRSRMQRTGMMSAAPVKKNPEEEVHPWGWGDETIPEEDTKIAETMYKKE
ncbi:acyl-CoA Delta-9 desaturase isoform X1 [Halyomorpha halys]|uniref:acyl-CoA Delta-9 desaturase isoform X1 n=2 Tax=Halyomorpha halys TaxID=286706 RepID=UPI0034D317A8